MMASRNRRILGMGLLLVVQICWPVCTSAAIAPPHPFRVVIDPGHGGADEGTVYQGRGLRVSEKQITLELAKQVANKLYDDGVTAILTRSTDEDLPLPARTAIANQLHADVFLSIHLNSAASRADSAASGVETYILNHATDASSHRLARLENRILPRPSPTAPTTAGETPDVALILKDLKLDANTSESKRLACTVQHSLLNNTPYRKHGHRDRGVKQALFYVLLGADMPSILVEAGFLSSPRDRAILLTPAGQDAVSTAIARAVRRFRRNKSALYAHQGLGSCKVN